MGANSATYWVSMCAYRDERLLVPVGVVGFNLLALQQQVHHAPGAVPARAPAALLQAAGRGGVTAHDEVHLYGVEGQQE